MLADLDLDLVLERVIEAARDLTGARYAAVGILDRSRSGLEERVELLGGTLGIDAAPMEGTTVSRAPGTAMARRADRMTSGIPGGAAQRLSLP